MEGTHDEFVGCKSNFFHQVGGLHEDVPRESIEQLAADQRTTLQVDLEFLLELTGKRGD